MNSPDKENRCPHPHLHLLSLKSLSDPELCPLSEPEEDPDTDTDDDANMKSSEAEDVKAVPSSGAKAKTLQPLARLAAGNSLKRSITLPRNPFASAGSSRSSSAPPQAANNNNQAAKKAKSNSAENGHAPSANNSAQLKSVKNFFNRFVTQIQLNSRNGIKFGDGSRDSHGWKKRLEEGKVPGVIGIRNHGNTCFINAILQCLSYTDILAEYFVLDQYKSDLKRKRRIASLTHFSKRTGKREESVQIDPAFFSNL